MRSARAPSAALALTATEARILTLRAQGLRRCEIARMLHRSPQTISNLLTVAKEKLGARTLIEAAYVLASARTRDVTNVRLGDLATRADDDSSHLKHSQATGPYKA
jgi:DNA-binding CsgD family transcriptional regulator